MPYRDPIVVTGLGTVTPFGIDVEAYWEEVFDYEAMGIELQTIRQQKALFVSQHWKPEELLGKRGLRFMVPGTKYLMGATKLALGHAGLLESMPDSKEIGIVVGCNFTGMDSATNYDLTAITEGPKFVSPMQAPNALANSPASQLGIKFGAKACNTTLSTGQGAGLDAIGYGMNLLNKNRAKFVIVGGVEQIDEQIIWLYEQSKLLPTTYHSQQGFPFLNSSKGIIPSEGAGVAILEKKSTALKRGANILGEVEGWESKFSLNRGQGHRAKTMKRTISKLLSEKSLSASDIDLVMAGANGCPELDRVEYEVLSELFECNNTPIYPIKQKIGESFGASGLLQLITAIGVLTKQKLPAGVQSRILQPSIVSDMENADHQNNETNRILLTSQNYSGEISTVMVGRASE
jgi:3-oxoacyl-[acyl-carrier-protein] synthase II